MELHEWLREIKQMISNKYLLVFHFICRWNHFDCAWTVDQPRCCITSWPFVWDQLERVCHHGRKHERHPLFPSFWLRFNLDVSFHKKTRIIIRNSFFLSQRERKYHQESRIQLFHWSRGCGQSVQALRRNDHVDSFGAVRRSLIFVGSWD